MHYLLFIRSHMEEYYRRQNLKQDNEAFMGLVWLGVFLGALFFLFYFLWGIILVLGAYFTFVLGAIGGLFGLAIAKTAIDDDPSIRDNSFLIYFVSIILLGGISSLIGFGIQTSLFPNAESALREFWSILNE